MLFCTPMGKREKWGDLGGDPGAGFRTPPAWFSRCFQHLQRILRVQQRDFENH